MSKGLVKGVLEGGRDELPEAKVFVHKLKEGRDIIQKHVLTLEKGFF